MTAITSSISLADAPRRRKKPFKVLGVALLGLLPLVLLLLVWQLFGGPDDFSFPRPDRWWEAFLRMWERGEFLPALQQTMLIFILGLAASIVVGTLLGWALGASRTLDRALSPVLDFFRSMPAPALIPIAIVLLGITLGMSVVVMVITVVWPILLNAVSSRRNIPDVRLEMARTLGISRAGQMFKIVFPSLLPDVMTGIRTAASVGLVAALVLDILGSGSGIGRLLVTKQQSFDAAAVWALLVVVAILGGIVNWVVAAIDQRVQRGR